MIPTPHRVAPSRGRVAAIPKSRLAWGAACALVSPCAAALTELAGSYGGCADTITTQTVNIGPVGNYQAAIDAAALPGRRIVLSGGTYSNGLRLYDVHGAPGNCLVIEGPADRSAVLAGAPINGVRNVVQIRNSSFVVLRNLEIDGTGTTDLDGVKSDATIAGAHAAAWSHHITLDNLHIHDFAADQQQVGISTKGPAWNWVVRNSTIERVGTGIYFGNSDGGQHFVNGLIEFNLIRDTIGYNMQIKHQFAASRPSGAGFETLPGTARTVIRHNVFHKSGNSAGGGNARPNLLVGAFPLAGAGADDDYVIAGNFFHRNPGGSEALFQGEGNVIFFGNLLYNDQGPGLAIQPQNGEVRRIRVFQNTVLSTGTGIFVSSNVSGLHQQLVRGNAVFAAGTPIAGGDAAGNVTDSLVDAAAYLANPDGVISGAIDRLDLHPLAGALSDIPIDTGPISPYADFDRDFDDTARDGTIRGAYHGESGTPGWVLALEIKPQAPSARVFADGFED
jgi:hypothetical protein